MLSISDKALETAIRMRDQHGENIVSAVLGLRLKVEDVLVFNTIYPMIFGMTVMWCLMLKIYSRLLLIRDRFCMLLVRK